MYTVGIAPSRTGHRRNAVGKQYNNTRRTDRIRIRIRAAHSSTNRGDEAIGAVANWAERIRESERKNHTMKELWIRYLADSENSAVGLVARILRNGK
jgi:hypothetical protein